MYNKKNYGFIWIENDFSLIVSDQRTSSCVKGTNDSSLNQILKVEKSSGNFVEQRKPNHRRGPVLLILFRREGSSWMVARTSPWTCVREHDTVLIILQFQFYRIIITTEVGVGKMEVDF